jgi:hypothetical protein
MEEPSAVVVATCTVPTPHSTEPSSQDRRRLLFKLCPYYSQWYPLELDQPFSRDVIVLALSLIVSGAYFQNTHMPP